MRILVVADMAPIAVGLQHFLTGEGYATDIAWSADEAIEMLKSDPSLSIVIWDLSLRRTPNVKRTITIASKIERLSDNGFVRPAMLFLGGPVDASTSASERDLRQLAHLLSPGNLVARPPDKADLLHRIRDIQRSLATERDAAQLEHLRQEAASARQEYPRPVMTVSASADVQVPTTEPAPDPLEELAPAAAAESNQTPQMVPEIHEQAHHGDSERMRLDATLSSLISRIEKIEAKMASSGIE